MLVYLSFAWVNFNQYPNWAIELSENYALKDLLNWHFYNPVIDVKEQLLQRNLGTLLQTKLPHYKAVKNKDILGLNNSLFLPLENVGQALFDTDARLSNKQNRFRDLFFLLRSDIVLVDIDTPDFGEISHSIIYAKMLDIPIVGISTTGTYFNYLTDYLTGIVNYKNINDIVKFLSLSGIEPATPDVNTPKPDTEKPKEETEKGLLANLSLLQEKIKTGDLERASLVEYLKLIQQGKEKHPYKFPYDEWSSKIKNGFSV